MSAAPPAKTPMPPSSHRRSVAGGGGGGGEDGAEPGGAIALVAGSSSSSERGRPVAAPGVGSGQKPPLPSRRGLVKSWSGSGVGAPKASDEGKGEARKKEESPPPPHPAAEAEASSMREEGADLVLYVAFGLFVVTSLGNRLFQKLMTIPMYNYPITVNLITVAAYVPLSFAYIVPMLHCVPDGPITPEQTAIPKIQFAIMGAFDCVASLMQVLSVNFIPNASTLVLLQQSAIPISMVVSRLSFKHVRYDWCQIAGAAVVLCGIGVVMSPQLGRGGPKASSSDGDDDDDHTQPASKSPGPQWIWQLTIILSCVPMCLGSVYKEKALGEFDVDVVYLNGWVAVFQTAMSLPLAVPTALATQLPLKDLPANVWDGFLCYLGRSTSAAPESKAPRRRLFRPILYSDDDLAYGYDDYYYYSSHYYDDDGDDDDDRGAGWGSVQQGPSRYYREDSCGTAPYFVTAFVAFNLAYNVLVIVILKRGSTSLLYLASTVLVPVSNVMFSLKIVPGHQPLHLADVVGLVVIMLGLILYRCGAAITTMLKARTARLATLLKLLVLEVGDETALDEDDNLDDEDDDDEPRRRRRRRRRDFLKIPAAERRSLLAAARARADYSGEDVPSPLLRESMIEAARRRHREERRIGFPRDRIARFFNISHIEMLQPLAQAQTLQVRRRLARSNAQIRNDFLLKLGFSPDPLASPSALARRSPMVPRGARPHSRSPRTESPGDLRRLQARRAAQAAAAAESPRRRPGSASTTPTVTAPSRGGGAGAEDNTQQHRQGRFEEMRRANSFDTRRHHHHHQQQHRSLERGDL